MVLYLCDPEKNAVCKKTFCAHLYSDGECIATTNPECAQLGKDGKPIPYAFVEDHKNDANGATS